MTAVEFKYLALGGLGGRGGVVRFFMLAHDVDFREELYDMNTEWPAAKAKIIEAGENPAGTVPVVKYDGKVLAQHIAIMRELAKDKGISAGSYVNDAVADQYQAFRDKWVDAAFMGADKEKFVEHTKSELKIFDAMFAKAAPYLEGDKPLWGDSAIFGLIRDLMIFKFITEADLPPNVKAMFDAYKAIPKVAAWIASKDEA